MFALSLGIVCAANAQEVKNDENDNSVSQVSREVTATSEETTDGLTLQKDVYPQQEEDGDLYHGLTRKLMFDRMIPPHGLEVTYDKTVHILFPASIRYVDLGSPNLIAGKADGAENVIRVKATVKNFRNETNMSVITEELGSESPMLVRLIMKSIHKENKRTVKHIGSKRFGIQYILKGVYVHNDLLYLHTGINNSSNVPFDVDYISFKVVDKEVAKRTAIQEQVLFPVRAFNYAVRVAGKQAERTVFCLPKFTIPDDKQLVVEVCEKNGESH